MTNDSGAWVEKYAYTLYGKPAAQSTVGNPYMYTGRRLDAETGLYYYRARYYDSHLRRFIETDPIGYAGGMNLYAYTYNSPINFTDPTGEAVPLILVGLCAGGGCEAIAGAVTGIVLGIGLGTAVTDLMQNENKIGCNPHDGTIEHFNNLVFPISGPGMGLWVPGSFLRVNDGDGGNESERGPVVYPENPDNARGKFKPIPGRKGKQNTEDGSVWERDHSSHGGEQWKRWPSVRDYGKGNKPQSIWPDGRIRK